MTTELRWRGDPSLIGQVDKQNMTVHRWFQNKACPGDYLYNRHGQIAEAVNALLREGNEMSNFEINDLIDKKIEAAKKEILAQINGILPKPAPVYDTLDEVPDWGKAAVARRIQSGVLRGSGYGKLGLTEQMVRMWVIDDREDEDGIG